jgi:hypothetical protein
MTRSPSPPSPDVAFDGYTYVPPRDFERLNLQVSKVFNLMADGKWRTLAGIAETLNAPPASVSARLRDLRKEKWGSYVVERRYLQDGLYEYRVVVPDPKPEQLKLL